MCPAQINTRGSNEHDPVINWTRWRMAVMFAWQLANIIVFMRRNCERVYNSSILDELWGDDN